MRDPDLVQRAERAATALEQAWMSWRERHGFEAGRLSPVSSYVGYSVEEPWGQPRVVLGIDADGAERLAAILEGYDRLSPVHAGITAWPARSQQTDALGTVAGWSTPGSRDIPSQQPLPASNGAAAVQPMAEQPAAVQSIAEQPAAVQSIAEQPAAVQSMAAAPVSASGDQGEQDTSGADQAGAQQAPEQPSVPPVAATLEPLPQPFPAAPILPVLADGQAVAGAAPATAQESPEQPAEDELSSGHLIAVSKLNRTRWQRPAGAGSATWAAAAGDRKQTATDTVV
jgi:hypothetical protein